MITSSSFSGRHYAVLGLARSGLATVDALLAGGARITAWDRQEEPRAKLAGRCELADPLAMDLAGLDGVVVSPGVPLNTHPITDKARAAGVPLIGDIELFAQARADLPAHKVVGITGTNGKSTTTALVRHILASAGFPTLMGGNIGVPILGQEPLPTGGVYVLELSSYQVDLTFSLDCDAAALSNITPDHLDRYGGFEDYIASKARLFAMQSPEHMAVFGCDDEPTRAIYERERARRTPGRALCADVAGLAPLQTSWPSLQGPHNLQNAALAAAIAGELGLTDEQVHAALASFRGLAHRMERIAEAGGVLYVNDSKATNPASTAPALAAFPPNPEARIHWICGGLPKGEDLGECAEHFGNVACAYTIGEAGHLFASILAPQVRVEQCEMLCEAVRRAVVAARPGDVVLFSPACASFDQFRDYEARGEAFRQFVGAETGGGAGASSLESGRSAA